MHRVIWIRNQLPFIFITTEWTKIVYKKKLQLSNPLGSQGSILFINHQGVVLNIEESFFKENVITFSGTVNKKMCWGVDLRFLFEKMFKPNNYNAPLPGGEYTGVNYIRIWIMQGKFEKNMEILSWHVHACQEKLIDEEARNGKHLDTILLNQSSRNVNCF